MKFKEFMNGRTVVFDGAMGTQIQAQIDLAGTAPDELSITRPELITQIHLSYLEAGADVIITNTFGANRKKQQHYTPVELIEASVGCAKEAVAAYRTTSDRPAYIALDLGPIGTLLAPSGSLSFEEAYEIYKEQVLAGTKAGVDLLLVETQTDLLEAKCAVLACKENSDLPVIATMSYEDSGRTFTGTDPVSMAVTLEGLGVSVLGMNCSFGTDQMEPLVQILLETTNLPILVQPNAGLPTAEKEAQSDEDFAADLRRFVTRGVGLIGGCCGTGPDTIRALRKVADETEVKRTEILPATRVCSFAKTVVLSNDPVVAGERINPTGKKAFQEKLREGSVDTVLREAVLQTEEGAQVLDVNVGAAGVVEKELLPFAVKEIQAILDTPLMLDSANPEALAAAARVYNGKPLINSVNGKEESLEKVLPVVKKYGACVLALTLDDDGIPETAQKRVEIARKILTRAEALGIPRENILVDCLTMTVSTGQDNAKITADAVERVGRELGLKTALGVSNVSFGLPNRAAVNRSFLQMALEKGLSLPIMNPADLQMMEAIDTHRVLFGKDKEAADYIQKYAQVKQRPETTAVHAETTLYQAIASGLSEETLALTQQLLEKKEPLQIIEEDLIPVLNEIGLRFEHGELYLPQLIRASETVKGAFELVKASLKSDAQTAGKGKVVLATVQHDVHDIGKNIVKIVLENYGFDVYDLGKDVAPETVLAACREKQAGFVGLSALMTTTVDSMERTIALLKREVPGVCVVVGGAVLNERYAAQIGADGYAKYPTDAARAATQYYQS